MAQATQKITRGIYLIVKTAHLPSRQKEFLVDVVLENGDYEEIHIVGGKKVVCHDCNGEGSHLGPSFRYQALEPELAQDDDFMRDYCNGVYNVRCDSCGGANVLDMPILNEEQDKAYKQWIREDDMYEAQVEMERRMGA